MDENRITNGNIPRKCALFQITGKTMKKFCGALFFLLLFSHSAVAQTCNTPSGFIQTKGNFVLGDALILGPDCNHVTDGGPIGGGPIAIQPKTSPYTMLPTDCETVISLGGNNFYNLTVPNGGTFPQACQITVYNADTSAGKFISINGMASYILWPLQQFIILNSSSTWIYQEAPPQRWKTPTQPIFYVNDILGSDSNDCLAAGSRACLTIQRAVSLVCEAIDANGFPPVVQLTSGQTYIENVTLCPPFGAPPGGILTTVASIIGDITQTGSNITTTIQTPALSVSAAVTAVNVNPAWALNSIKLVVNGGGAPQINCDINSLIYIGNIYLPTNGLTSPNMTMSYGGKIELQTDSTIGSGAAMATPSNGGIFLAKPVAITFDTGAQFPDGIYGANHGGIVSVIGTTYVGTVGGSTPAVSCASNAIVETNGATIPHTIANSVSTGCFFN